MCFNTFCNICFIKQNIIKLCEEENERMFNILISFTSCLDIVNGVIYLCTNCYNKLEEYDKFRELYLTNFVRFRYLYNEYKKMLEIRNEPDIEKQLQFFVDVNVERPSGTPLIENFEDIKNASKNNTACKIDITCRETDLKFSERDFDKMLHQNILMCTDTSFTPKDNISENETRNTHMNYENDSVIDDQENIDGSAIKKCETSLRDEDSNEFTNTDNVATSIPYHSTTFDESCNLLTEQKVFETVDVKLEKDELNPIGFEKVHNQFVSDTVGSVIPCPKLVDDSWNLSTNPQNWVTENTTVEEGPTHKTNRARLSRIVCNVCHKECPSRSKLQVHMRIHTGEKPYSCDECDKKFADISCLIRHKRIHSGGKPYKCDECDMRFAYRNTLHIHKQKKHRSTPAKKLYPCNVCGKIFTKRNFLRTHKRVHSNENPFKCDECGHSFKHSSHLNRHKLIHTDERPFSCDECHKAFKEIYLLKKHKLSHSGEKPYKCEECGNSFKHSSHLNRHKRIHTGERPYSCKECHRAFGDVSNLKKHTRIHNRK